MLLTAQKWPASEPADNPIALLDLAPIARAQGHEVECAWLGEIPRGDFEFIGLSVLSGWPGLRDAVCDLRRRFPYAGIAVGGKWAGAPDTALGPDVEIWPGSGEAFFGWDRPFEEYPAWEARDLAALHVDRMGVMSSRGCPYRCAFCHNTEKRVQCFSPVRTVENIVRLRERGVADVFFVDDVFTLDPDRMWRVLEEADRRGVELRGVCRFFTHVRHTGQVVISAMRAFEPAEVQIGIESGDARMLRAMNKGFAPADALRAVEVLADAGLPVRVLMLIGFPGETVESLENSLLFVRQVGHRVRRIWVSYYQPIPGTPGHALAEREGTLREHGRANTQIGYVPAGLTPAILGQYRVQIMGGRR